MVSVDTAHRRPERPSSAPPVRRRARRVLKVKVNVNVKGERRTQTRTHRYVACARGFVLVGVWLIGWGGWVLVRAGSALLLLTMMLAFVLNAALDARSFPRAARRSGARPGHRRHRPRLRHDKPEKDSLGADGDDGGHGR